MIYRDMFYLYRIFPTTSSLCDFVKGSLQSNDNDPTTISRTIELEFVQRKLYVELEELKKTVTAFIECGLGDLCRQT